MIKANELRIGNIVNIISRMSEVHIPVDIPFKVMGIEQFQVHLIQAKEDVLQSPGYIPIRLSDISHIPLAPEILEKCGFEKNDDAGNWNSPEHTIYSIKGMSVGIIDNYIGWYNQSEDDFYSSFYPKLTSLHQLQNLYFALTGKELEITL